MITKETVSKIIRGNTQSKNDSRATQQDGTIYQFSESRKALCRYIANLPTDELLDLLALMEYGRELHQQSATPSYSEYCKIQKRWQEENPVLEQQQKAEKAEYLLAKSELSAYLQAALPIFDLVDFEF